MLTMKDIVREGNPILRTVTDEVPVPPSEEDKQILFNMMQFLKDSQDPELAERYQLRPGVGLSANQLGLNKRMFTAYFNDEKGRLHKYALVNPKIISHSVSMIYLPQGEGCLSVDRSVPGFVPRYERIKVKAYDENGKMLEIKLKDYASIVIQHEIDHLNGMMFYDRINKENPFKLPDDVPIRSLY
ncbi:peptide deformylase [Scopulibacillus daqui]|uniref:Peptide deformylase n=1 Tax=Scopulibacillus daqui TaxID=1469162 RepID=A0ABS2PZH0_9BACL|nr:peptide deformylase [Scopulibacillus daqui]MBM7645449.1 peptide deformylase [Scopulibacillus daqui]